MTKFRIGVWSVARVSDEGIPQAYLGTDKNGAPAWGPAENADRFPLDMSVRTANDWTDWSASKGFGYRYEASSNTGEK